MLQFSLYSSWFIFSQSKQLQLLCEYLCIIPPEMHWIIYHRILLKQPNDDIGVVCIADFLSSNAYFNNFKFTSLSTTANLKRKMIECELLGPYQAVDSSNGPILKEELISPCPGNTIDIPEEGDSLFLEHQPTGEITNQEIIDIDNQPPTRSDQVTKEPCASFSSKEETDLVKESPDEPHIHQASSFPQSPEPDKSVLSGPEHNPLEKSGEGVNKEQSREDGEEEKRVGEEGAETSGAFQCASCGSPIEDRYLLYTLERYWHQHCLICAVCKRPLELLGPSCFTRDGLILCKLDYSRCRCHFTFYSINFWLNILLIFTTNISYIFFKT